MHVIHTPEAVDMASVHCSIFLERYMYVDVLLKVYAAVLKLIHEGHLGLNKFKLHVKETIFWPGLNDQLEKMILICELCLKYSQSKCKQMPTMSL